MAEAPKIDPAFYLNLYEPVSSIKCFQNQWILAGTTKGNIQAWNCKSRRAEQSIQLGCDCPILWLDITNENFMIVQARFSQTVRIFRFEDSGWTSVSNFDLLKGHNGFCKGDTVNSKIILPEGDNSLVLAHLAGDKGEISSRLELENNVTCMKFVLNNQCLVGLETGILKLMDNTLSVLKTIDIKQLVPQTIKPDSPLSMDVLNSDGIITFAGAVVLSFRLDAGDITCLKVRMLPSEGMTGIRIRRSDAKIVAGASWDSTIRLFSWLKPEKLKPLGALKFHTETPTCIDFSKDSWAFCGSMDGKISVWSNLYS